MLSQLGDKIRGFFEQSTRKRQAERLSDDVVDSPAKRTREDNSSTNHTPWSVQVQFSKMAEWIVTRKASFADSYYYKQIMKSPKEARKRVVVNSSQDGRNNSSQVEGRDTSGSSANYSWSGRHGQATPVNKYSHGYSFSRTQTDMPDSFHFSHPTEDAAFKSFKAPQPPIHKVRSPNSTHQSSVQGAESPPYRGSTVSVRSKASAPRYRSMYDKTYRNDPNKRRNVWNRSKLATKESFRLEEKNRYAELLQKFTSTPVAGSLFGSCFPGLTQKSRQPSENESFFGMTMESTRMPDKTGSDVTITQPTTVKTVERQILTPSASITDRSYRYLQAKRSAEKNFQPASFRFDTPELPRQALSFEKMIPDVTSTPIVSTPESDSDVIILSEEQLPSVVRTPKSEEFVKSIKESKYMTDEWLYDLKNSYCSQARTRDRKIKEEEVKVHYFKEKREEFEDSLEKRLRERLALVEREPPALIETFEEEKEEKEEDEFPQLTEDQEALIDSSLVPYPNSQVLVEGFKLQIMRKDMATLAGLNWLNDEIINFYMNMLMERGHQDNYSEVHAFNTFFYPKIMSSGHTGVKRWTRRIDIFAVDFILIPIHLGMHWCLAVIDFLKKEIRYYDSMGGRNDACLNALKNYLEEESLDKKKTSYDTSDWKLITVKDIPHQMNGSDCGMFTCKFAEYVTRKAPITFTQEYMPYFRRRMVYEILTKQLM